LKLRFGNWILPPFTFAACLLALEIAPVRSFSADQSAAPSGYSNNAGLVNDWLRQRSGNFANWDLGGQFRLRYEDKENAGSFPSRDFIRLGQDNSNDDLLLRTRIHLGITPLSWITVYGETRDSRQFWDRRVPSPEADAFDLHQAFVSLGDPKRFPLSLKVGRQELIYDDQRFIGNGDWSDVGRVFDAAKLRFENETFWVDAFAGRVVLPYDGRFNVVNDYDWFSGLYASSRKLAPWQETQLFFLSRNVSAGSRSVFAPGVSVPGPRDIYSMGTRWKSLPGQLGGWDYGLEAIAQFGSVNSGGQTPRRLDQESFGVFVSGGYTWTNAWGAPRLGIGYDYGSGDTNPNDGKNGTFENLFGTLHKFYGMMDLFGARNLHIPRVSASLEPVKGLTLSADFLWFRLVETTDYLYPESASARNTNGYGLHPGFRPDAGSELDLVANYKLTPWASLQAGYGHFFVGDYIRQSVAAVPANGGAVDANWGYVQMTIAF